MLSTSPATTPPWAWRLFKAADSDDERFLIAFLHAPSQEDWSCDEVPRTEGEARAYALLYGVSPGNFTTALERIRLPPKTQARA
jgi:hypothetical protein